MRGKRDDSKDGGGRATQEAKAEFTGVNDRLSAFLTLHGSERTFMRRSQ